MILLRASDNKLHPRQPHTDRVEDEVGGPNESEEPDSEGDGVGPAIVGEGMLSILSLALDIFLRLVDGGVALSTVGANGERTAPH